MKPTGPTNPYLKKLIENLKRKSLELKAPIWKDVAKKLAKPRRKRISVNLSSIERHTKAKDTVIVPGIVLGSGELTKPVDIAAWKFSAQAREKIKKAKGKSLTIEEILEKNPRGSKIKIIT